MGMIGRDDREEEMGERKKAIYEAMYRDLAI